MENAKPYALITGASSGIGYQYARILAARGYNLVIVSNVASELHDKQNRLHEEFGVTVLALDLDLGQQQAAKQMFDECRSRNITVEVLVNNAGVYHGRDFLDDSAAFNHTILNLHMHTPAMAAYYFGHEMVKRGRGYILNMSSITGSMPVQTLATYGATKRFVRNFSRSLHTELHGKGVVVTAICPGAVATSLYHLSERMMKIGLKIGLITTPERLAKRAVRAMFRKRVNLTPGWFNRLAAVLVGLIPARTLRWIRKKGWY